MDTNSLVIITGLISALIVYAAVQDSGASTAPATMQWKFGESWTTSTAAILALTAIAVLDASEDEIVVLFGLMLLLGPLLYRGFSQSSSASMGLFFAVGTLMSWATLAILVRVTSVMFSITRFELAVVPRLVLNAAVVAALLGAAMSIYAALRSAAAGDKLSADGVWILP